jgi:hypothetical protein
MSNIKFGDGWVIIGVDHEHPISLKDKDLDNVLEVFSTNKNVWIEGMEPEFVVSNFIEEHLPDAHVRSWEPTKPLSKMTALILSLFGGDTEAIVRQVSEDSSFDPTSNILDNLIATQASWYEGPAITKQDIQKLLSLQQMESNGVKPFDAFESFHQKGFDLTWESGETSFSKLANVANEARVENIKKLMANTGGVFFAGYSHLDVIHEAVKLLFLKQIVVECFSKR